MYALWRPLPQVIWQVPQGAAALAVNVLFWTGWAIVLASTFLINHFELFGLKQVWDRFRQRAPEAPHFVTPPFYKVVRHPLYLGFILAFWAAPTMTLGRLIFAVGTLGYILVAIQLEERDMMGVFGDRYRTYMTQVGMLTPKLFGRRKPERAA
jgi:protein-S-isoprenylcysteine O-methyltransferase Ste14